MNIHYLFNKTCASSITKKFEEEHGIGKFWEKIFWKLVALFTQNFWYTLYALVEIEFC